MIIIDLLSLPLSTVQAVFPIMFLFSCDLLLKKCRCLWSRLWWSWTCSAWVPFFFVLLLLCSLSRRGWPTKAVVYQSLVFASFSLTLASGGTGEIPKGGWEKPGYFPSSLCLGLMLWQQVNLSRGSSSHCTGSACVRLCWLMDCPEFQQYHLFSLFSTLKVVLASCCC